MTKAKYSCGLACISFFVNQGLQMLINNISLVLSESLVYTCEPQAWRYLIWHVSVVHVQPETTILGTQLKQLVLGTRKTTAKGWDSLEIILGYINTLGMKPLDIAKVGKPVKPNNRGNYLLCDIDIIAQTGLQLFRSSGSQDVNNLGWKEFIGVLVLCT